jgi:UDP-glucose 4-epimerase
MKAPKTILVTGCAGFIGSVFAKEFARRFPKTRIVGIDDLSAGRRDAVSRAVLFHKGSVVDKRFLDSIFKKYKPEYVFHFAALPRVAYTVAHPVETTEVNVGGTVRLLEECRVHKVRRFIFSSSSAIYGNVKKLPVKEATHTANPESPYALQKYTSELFCKQFSELFGVETVSLRYFNVFGPGDYGSSAYSTVVSAWLESMYFPKNKKGFIEGDGKQTRDFAYVRDVIHANILAMSSTKKFNGEIFNISSGKGYSLNEIQKLIESYTKRKLTLEKRPPRMGDVRHTLADVSKARTGLGYRPRTNFQTGLKETVLWFERRVASSDRTR